MFVDYWPFEKNVLPNNYLDLVRFLLAMKQIESIVVMDQAWLKSPESALNKKLLDYIELMIVKIRRENQKIKGSITGDSIAKDLFSLLVNEKL